MLKHCKYGQFSSQRIMSVIHRYSMIYLVRFHLMNE